MMKRSKGPEESAVQVEVDRELASRLRAASLAHIGLLAVVTFGTRIRIEHPWVLAISGSLILLFSVLRFQLAGVQAKFAAERSRTWRRYFLALLLLSTAAWSLISTATIALYSLETFTCTLVLLVTAGIAAGGTSSLSPDARLSRGFLVLLFAAPCGVLLGSGPESVALGFTFVFYAAFLWAQAGAQGRWFHRWKRMELQQLSEFRAAEGKLRQTMESAFESIPSIVWTAEPDGLLDYYNQRWFDYTGLTLAETQGWGWKPVLHPEDLALCVERWTRSISTGEAYEIEYRFKQASTSQYRWHLARALAIRDDSGRIIKWVGTCTDIHDQKSALEAASVAQSALEASKLKSDFMASMSHEIRTPINGIMGMAELVSGTRLTPEQKSYVDVIQSAGTHLLSLVNDILDFAKIEAGKLELENSDFELGALTTEVEQLMGSSAKLKGLKYGCAVSTLLPLRVRGDSGRLRQVLINLVGNAIKFTHRGEVVVSVREHEEGGRKLVRFEVRDTGIGISEETGKKLFQPFSQADSSMNRRYGGSGLGLSICKQLVAMMGGQLGMTSIEGSGSVFWFALPLEVSTGLVVGERQTPTLAGQRRLNVLLAEDNAVNQLITVRMLEKYGHRVDAVVNGREAILALHQIPYDLILMDCQMPELDGYEATRLIRKGQALGRSETPIIALTANALKGDRERCLSVGMNEYVSKPVKSEELMRVIARVLDAASARV